MARRGAVGNVVNYSLLRRREMQNAKCKIMVSFQDNFKFIPVGDISILHFAFKLQLLYL